MDKYSKFYQTLIAGIVATIVMTIIIILSGYFGLPELKPPMMLSSALGTSVIIGWIMHFLIGIIFALLYAYVFLPVLKGIRNGIGRGVLFGILAFVIAQIAMYLMGQTMAGIPEMEGGIVATLILSFIVHLIFGVVIAIFITEEIVVVTE